MYDSVQVYLDGRRDLFIENYKGLQTYTDEYIAIKTKNETLKITGSKLHIEYYSNEEMKITGYFSEVKFEE